MSTYFDVPITIYNGYRETVGREGTIREFLMLGTQYREAIERLRKAVAEGKKDVANAIKSTLPCATISGVFYPKRSKHNLVSHSGMICIDIDHVEDCAKMIQEIATINTVAYVSRSVSGQGVFALIPLAYPDRHEEQFESLKQYFAGRGIEIDAACKDVSRLRGLSYDACAMGRFDAVPYTGIVEEEKRYTHHRPQSSFCNYDGDIATDTLRRSFYDVLLAYGYPAKRNAEYLIQCPFHDDKTPSCSINTAKGVYHCHGCAEEGDTLTFVAKIEGLNLHTAEGMRTTKNIIRDIINR